VLISTKSELGSPDMKSEDVLDKNTKLPDEIRQNADRSVVLDAMTHDWETNTLIAHALVRIGDGTYGRCEECDEHISAKRLAALPWARFCVDCQEKIDRASDRGSWGAAA
jgi:DnaK suppressor protein